VGKVLQHLAADHGIEGVVRKRQGIDFTVAHLEMNSVLTIDPGVPFRLVEDVQRMALVSETAEEGSEHPLSGPHIQDLRAGLQTEGDFAETVDAAPKEVLQLGIIPRVELSRGAKGQCSLKNRPFVHPAKHSSALWIPSESTLAVPRASIGSRCNAAPPVDIHAPIAARHAAFLELFPPLEALNPSCSYCLIVLFREKEIVLTENLLVFGFFGLSRRHPRSPSVHSVNTALNLIKSPAKVKIKEAGRPEACPPFKGPLPPS